MDSNNIRLAIGGITTILPVDAGYRLASKYLPFASDLPAQCTIDPGPPPADFHVTYRESGLEVGNTECCAEVLRFSHEQGSDFYLQFSDQATAIHSAVCPTKVCRATPFPNPPVFITSMIHFLTGKGILLHAAAGIFGGKGFAFCGPSGVGKSTLAMAWAAAGAQVLCDERVILNKSAPGFRVHGSPWPGSYEYVSAGSAPLTCLALLRPTGPAMEPVASPAEFIKAVLPETYHKPWNHMFTAFLLSFLGDLYEHVSVVWANRTAAADPRRFVDLIEHWPLPKG